MEVEIHWEDRPGSGFKGRFCVGRIDGRYTYTAFVFQEDLDKQPDAGARLELMAVIESQVKEILTNFMEAK